jgi:hypothetical protein
MLALVAFAFGTWGQRPARQQSLGADVALLQSWV